jgi:hypothetical protein
MHDLTATRVRDTTTLSPEQRERLRREGRIARAVEAAQRRTGGRFTSTVRESRTPGSRPSGRRRS